MPIMTTARTSSGAGLELHAPLEPGFAKILTAEARRFLTVLARASELHRQELLARRVARQRRLDAGERPDFLPETRSVREADWTVAPIPADLLDRRVEITGPVDRKMVINALNSGARVFMADFEDSNAPTWRNSLEGQLNLLEGPHTNRWRKALSAMDQIRDRFGEDSVSLAGGLQGRFRERVHENPAGLPGKAPGGDD